MMASLDYAIRKPLENVTVKVTWTGEASARMWMARKLVDLAVWVLGGHVEFYE